jgi:ribonuclease Z
VRPAVLRFGDLRLEGCSRAGEETWFRVHPPGLAFDVGRGPLQLAGARDLFLSHGHLDHALGLPFVLSQRSLHRREDSRVFCPRELAPRLAALVAAAEAMEGSAYRWELIPLDPGDRVEVGRGMVVEAFATDHVVPSLGYHLHRAKRHLAERYRGLAPGELAALRRRGIDPAVAVEELLLTYCGDTGPGVFDLEPRVFSSRILLLECTFLDPEHRDRGRRFGHLHLEDLAARVGRFANEELVLYHLSRRHDPGELERLAGERLAGLAPRLHVLAAAP